MAASDKNVLQTVLSILGTTPDEKIKSDAWIEIFKLQLALKGLASAIDSLREKATAISAGQQVTYQTAGNVEYALYLQDLTKVNVVAGATIAAGLAVRFVPNGAGGILALPAIKYAKVDGFCVNGVSAGAVGEFILKGFIGYSKYTVNKFGTSMDGEGYAGYPTINATSHFRLSTHYYGSDGSYAGADGYFSWYNAYVYYNKKVTDPPSYNYVGVSVGNSGGTWLAYFNPEKF